MSEDELREQLSAQAETYETDNGEYLAVEVERVLAIVESHVKQREERAALRTLDDLIDINGKVFMHWSQKDIAHFFDAVGKQYRKHEAQLANLTKDKK